MITDKTRAELAAADERMCLEEVARCDQIIATSNDPAQRVWAQEERLYYTLRAESSRGLALNP